MNLKRKKIFSEIGFTSMMRKEVDMKMQKYG